MKQFKKILVVMMLLIVGVNLGSQVVNAETAVDQQETTSYIPPQSRHYTWNSPFDFGPSKSHRVVLDGYVYQGTLYKTRMDGWLFVYSGTLYRTPNVVPVSVVE